MTLQTLVTILNFNDLFKDSPESVKITAINQVLNNLEIEKKYINGSEENGLALQVDKYQNVTYRYLNEVMGLNFKEDIVLALFQYSLMDFTNDNPLDTTFVDPVSEKILTLGYSVQFRNSQNIIGDLTFGITPIVKIQYKYQPQETKESILQLTTKISYKDDIVKEDSNKNFSLDYLVNFSVRDISYPLTFDLDYSTTYSVY